MKRFAAITLGFIVLVLLSLSSPFRFERFSYITSLAGPVASADEIDVQTDWGAHKTITSEKDIRKIVACLNRYPYRKIISGDKYAGYLYSLEFKRGGREIGLFVLGGEIEINGKKYAAQENSKIGEELVNIVGLRASGR